MPDGFKEVREFGLTVKRAKKAVNDAKRKAAGLDKLLAKLKKQAAAAKRAVGR
jgi:hypothetical protein